MKTDAQLQKDVENAIKWEPLLNTAEILVAASGGFVSLSGAVDSYAKKLEAENAAKKVMGVKNLIENIEVRFANSWTRSDAEITSAVLSSLNANWVIPNGKVTVSVEDGWVTLEGVLSWNYQREASKNSVAYLIGVKGITNNIIIQSDIHDTIDKRFVEDAISRCWSLDSNNIQVTVLGTLVTLSGRVNSLYQREEAGRIAWKTPGILSVSNDLKVEDEITFS